MKNNKFIDFISSLPFLLMLLFVVSVVIFYIFITPSYDYVLQSQVVTQSSYLRLNKEGNGKFFFVPNLFPEIKKKSSFQTDIPEIELQKAALRMETKIKTNLKANPDSPQTVFDISLWYIVSAGIKDNINQLKINRAARLIAAYYYLKIFNEMEPDYTPSQGLERIINNYIDKNAKNNPEFYNYLTMQKTKNLEEPPAQIDIEQEKLYNLLSKDDNQETNLKNLCDFYKENINTHKKSRKYAFLVATRYCYEELYRLNPENNDNQKEVKNLSKLIENFKFTK